MRKVFLCLFLIYSLYVSSQTLNKQTIAGLEYIGRGYINYGFEELKSAATVNDMAAQYYVAVCYEKGIVVEQNPIEAFKWYRRAAERGLPDAMYQLAIFYQKGIAVIRSDTRSNEWLKRYNDKGSRMTLSDIGDYYNEGLKHPENFAMNPNGSSETDSTVLAASGGSGGQVINHITVVQQQSQTPQNEQKTSQTITTQSDVDRNIPVNSQKNENTFALIIANENYQTVEDVPNALNDGYIFAEYCRKTLGLPDTNVHFVKDATLNNIRRGVNLVNQIATVYGNSSKLIVYYAGHGIPDEATRSAYLLPIDGYASDLSTCYCLNDLYGTLGKMPSSQIVVLLDACFSGSLRGDGMLASARGVAIKAKSGVPTGQMIVLSASQGDETAYPLKEEGHGLFTYYLLKKIQETKGNVTIGELASFIIDNVRKKSLVINGKLQTPTVSSSVKVSGWESWKLN